LWAIEYSGSSQSLFGVHRYAAALALTSLLASIAGLIWSKKRFALPLIVSAYSFQVIALTANVVLKGDLTLFDATLWSLLAVFGGVFGSGVVLTLLIAITGYITYLVILSPEWFSPITTSLVLLFPVLVGAALWLQRGRRTQTKADHVASLKQQRDIVIHKADIIVESITDGVIAIDSYGKIQLINPAAAQLVGWTVEDATDIKYTTVLTLGNKNDAGESTYDLIASVLRSGQTLANHETELTSQAGKKRTISLTVSAVEGDDPGLILIFKDVSDIYDENRQKGEFISTASHEMRTPVASIEGYLGLALNPSTATIDDKARLYLGKAHESAQHLGRLFQDLLDISRAEDGHLSNNPVALNLTDTLRQYVADYQLKAVEKQLKLSFAPDNASTSAGAMAPVFYALVDKDHFREIMANLIENAIKYTPSGEVSVDVTGDQDSARVTVSDTGIGISPEDIPHLFQKFYRIDNSDTREIGGTGLGLYLCRRLAEAMEGRLWIESERGKGSQFILEIKRISAEDAARQQTQTASATNTPQITSPQTSQQQP